MVGASLTINMLIKHKKKNIKFKNIKTRTTAMLIKKNLIIIKKNKISATYSNNKSNITKINKKIKI